MSFCLSTFLKRKILKYIINYTFSQQSIYKEIIVYSTN